MRRQIWIAVWVVALFGAGRELHAQSSCCPPPADVFLKRLAPVGGWCPYGGPLIHWWPWCCFPCKAAPDDYCRKPLPRVCWPPYPPYYIWGPPEVCPPQAGCCCPADGKPR
jgi:hypothetical protein